MKEGIYKISVDCGRAGYLEGVFVADDTDIKLLIKEPIEVYFGEVLGKHSEVIVNFEDSEVEFITDDEKVVDIFKQYDFSSGFNPFENTYCHSYYNENLENIDYDDMSVQELINELKKTL